MVGVVGVAVLGDVQVFEGFHGLDAVFQVEGHEGFEGGEAVEGFLVDVVMATIFYPHTEVVEDVDFDVALEVEIIDQDQSVIVFSFYSSREIHYFRFQFWEGEVATHRQPKLPRCIFVRNCFQDSSLES